MSCQARIARRIIFQMAMFVFIQLAKARDTLQQGELIHDDLRLKSSKGLFELGFFSIGSPVYRYLGIWFGGITAEQTVVWVANKENPITDTSGYLTIDTTHGRTLMVSDHMGKNITLFSDFISGTTSKNLTLKLLDSGNLVLRDEYTGQLLWQSIDHPCNAFLPGMKLGINKRTGQVRQLTSWLSPDIPAPGAFTLSADFNGTKQLAVHQRGEAIWRSGTWDGNDFTFFPWIKLHLNFSFVSSDDEHYFVYHDENNTSFSIWVMKSTGEIVQYARRGNPGSWYVFGLQSVGSCASQKMPLGCLGTLASNCSLGDDFVWWSKISGVDLAYYDKLNSSRSLSDCEALCRMDCSCVGYTSTYDNHTGCYLFGYESLPQVTSLYGEQDVYSRLSSGPMSQQGKRNRKLMVKFITAVAAVFAILLASSLAYYLLKFGIRKIDDENIISSFPDDGTFTGEKHKVVENRGPELQSFTLARIRAATDNFSTANKLGKGGFGPVYKGMFLDGQEIAVKKLSRSSGQGVAEFKNELALIGKLQHTNSVKLLGFCFEEEEKNLLYEFMPNKSLDYFLFDKNKAGTLDWVKRIHIMEGIAQGLLYLHKYSRLRVIHRDIKASNILLDSEMNPKISDFGMARIFDKNKSQANTRRVVGTYGYMSPEYAMEGLFSVKSDIFSFGVVMLKIVSGKRNSSFHNSSHYQNLLGYAWELWRDGRGLELMDKALTDSAHITKVTRCIHVGLLCVQAMAKERPTMSEVLFMLGNESASLPSPKLPAFAFGYTAQHDATERREETCSNNEVTVSEMEAR